MQCIYMAIGFILVHIWSFQPDWLFGLRALGLWEGEHLTADTERAGLGASVPVRAFLSGLKESCWAPPPFSKIEFLVAQVSLELSFFGGGGSSRQGFSVFELTL